MALVTHNVRSGGATAAADGSLTQLRMNMFVVKSTSGSQCR